MAYKIVLDAGHGGEDPGAVYIDHKEKDDNLSLALAVGKILEDNGIDVVYTRTTDIYQTPFEKARFANETGADFFISFHRNSSPESGQYNGVEVLVYDKKGIKYQMAENIVGALGELGFKELGVKERPGLVVLRRTKMPALLIETGFINSDKDNELFDNRIKVVRGDIVKKNLGLSEKDYSELKNNVDTVINSGALVKHFGIKKKFEEINVKGTQSVIDFCLNTKKRLLHVSTISVSGNGEKEETVIETPENINDKKIFKESDIYVGQNIKGVYSTTKFRAELLVLEAISSKGLDAQILRLGNITNRYSDGVFQMNTDENAFAKRIKSFIEIGAFPNYLLPHSIELTPVDLAAEAIVKVANYTSYCNVLHIYNNNLLPIKLFIETLSELGINLLPVPEKMMTDIITGILADNNRKDILSGIIYDLNENKQLVYTSRIRLNSNFTECFLEKIGFNWKNIDKEYIIKYICYLKKINFI